VVIDIEADAKILTSPGDNAFRWRHGERLEDLFEDHCDALRRAGRGGDLAVDGPAGRLTYDELDAAANRVARFLVRGLRIQPGDRVGPLFDDAVDGYICMLAVLKVHAVYVPMDPGFPADRSPTSRPTPASGRCCRTRGSPGSRPSQARRSCTWTRRP
jgi:non-ribosomal peptide synthetase component F